MPQRAGVADAVVWRAFANPLAHAEAAFAQVLRKLSKDGLRRQDSRIRRVGLLDS